jgi:hypothetical protein
LMLLTQLCSSVSGSCCPNWLLGMLMAVTIMMMGWYYCCCFCFSDDQEL